MLKIINKDGKTVTSGANLWGVSNAPALKDVKAMFDKAIADAGQPEEEISMLEYEKLFEHCLSLSGYTIQHSAAEMKVISTGKK